VKVYSLPDIFLLTPAAEGHGLWPWMNASRQWTGDVAPLGREVCATGFARGAPRFEEINGGDGGGN